MYVCLKKQNSLFDLMNFQRQNRLGKYSGKFDDKQRAFEENIARNKQTVKIAPYLKQKLA